MDRSYVFLAWENTIESFRKALSRSFHLFPALSSCSHLFPALSTSFHFFPALSLLVLECRGWVVENSDSGWIKIMHGSKQLEFTESSVCTWTELARAGKK
jgi:hypothetical protein